jgi:hypothetical protein
MEWLYFARHAFDGAGGRVAWFAFAGQQEVSNELADCDVVWWMQTILATQPSQASRIIPCIFEGVHSPVGAPEYCDI